MTIFSVYFAGSIKKQMQITFRINYFTQWGESLAVLIGDKKYPMEWGDGAWWHTTIDLKASALADYTYLVMRDGLIWRTEWDHHSTKLTAGSHIITDSWRDCPIPGCPFPRAHQAEMFDTPGFRCAGTVIPVFSLRTADDFGIGEFNDLRPLVDWAAATGQRIIQLLPVNDTTRGGGWADSYPYSPVSTFALNPMYIHLQDIGVKETAAFKRQQAALNALPELDYPRVFESKMALVRKAFEERGARDIASAAFKKYSRDNAGWLGEYAEFCARRDGDEAEFHAWIQFHLEKQFSKAADYARSKGVAFKGDLPIGVSADSAEAYWHPELFNLDSSTGAPPDFFSTDGQNWGFPTYNWDNMAGDNYAWWKSRLRKMSRWFDAFRIDHILGFFRIWEIPAEKKSGMYGHFNPALPYSFTEINALGLPLEGLFHADPRHPGMYQPLISPDKSGLDRTQKARFEALYNDFFFHRHDEFWRRNAEKKLPELLSATGMLACGEDLGMVPDCLPCVMEHEKILSMEMAMMDKGRPWPQLSVCAPSSHDMSTLRMQNAEAGKGDLPAGEVRRILWDHLASASMLAVFPLQDWLALDEGIRRKDFMEERINHPENPHHHWRYRVHIDLGSLKDASALNSQVTAMIKDSGR